MSALLDELADLHQDIEQRRNQAEGLRSTGDFLAAQRCTDAARGIEHAVLSIEDALFDAFDLWQQYRQQDP